MPPPQQIPGTNVTVTFDATSWRNITAFVNDPKKCAPAPAPSYFLVLVELDTRWQRERSSS